MKKKEKIYPLIDQLKSIKNYYFKKKQAPSGLIISFGNRGVGKSTNIAKDYYKWLKKDHKQYTHFYSNVELKKYNDNYHYLDLNKYYLTDYIPITEKTINGRCYTDPTTRKDKYGNYLTDTPFKIEENSIIELDELGIISHNRDWKNTPQEFKNLIKYLRKLGILFKANSQEYDIDVVIRRGANELRMMKKIGNINISRLYNKKITIKKAEESQNAESQIVDEITPGIIILPGVVKLTYIPKYTDLFDSFK